MQQVARVTGGKAFAIDDAARAAAQVYERLGSELATEKAGQEVTSLFAGGALLAVLRRRRRRAAGTGRLV